MKDISRVVHAGVCKDINIAFSTEIDHWPVAMQVSMCPPKRTAVKNTPRWDRAAAAVGHLCDSDVQGCATVAMSELRKAKRDEASCLYLLWRKQMEKRSCLVSDRETHWREIANSAEAADRAGDARSTFRLIRALGAFRTTTLPGRRQLCT